VHKTTAVPYGLIEPTNDVCSDIHWDSAVSRLQGELKGCASHKSLIFYTLQAAGKVLSQNRELSILR
jgi:hypothetical protein